MPSMLVVTQPGLLEPLETHETLVPDTLAEHQLATQDLEASGARVVSLRDHGKVQFPARASCCVAL